jgi:plasmid stabilization system protein ParE
LPSIRPAFVREGRIPATASNDVVRQFRYYLVDQNLPEIAIRFRDALRHTVEGLRQHPFAGARYQTSHQQLHNLRSWRVAGFEVIRIYYLAEADAIQIVRVPHGKGDLRQILEGEGTV